MVFLISLIVVTIFAVVFQKPLAKHPSIFYLIALASVGVYLHAIFFGVPIWLWQWFLVGIQRCTIALAFFSLVMFASVFAPGSRIYQFMQPLRRQLSILGAIFAAGHIVAYLMVYIPRFATSFSAAPLNLIVSFIVSLLITSLLLVLTVTSFVVVRKSMRAKTWKRVQKLSYAFFLLICVHLFFVLGPSALSGDTDAIINILVYALLFCGYSALRLRRAVAEKSSGQV